MGDEEDEAAEATTSKSSAKGEARRRWEHRRLMCSLSDHLCASISRFIYIHVRHVTGMMIIKTPPLRIFGRRIFP